MLFEPEWTQATEMCTFYDSKVIQFDCAGGIYMVAFMKKNATASEICSDALFPASCYRAAHLHFVARNGDVRQNPCEIESRFERRGCIWAEGTNMNSVAVCEKYYRPDMNTIDAFDYLSCVEGALTFSINTHNFQEVCPLYAQPSREYPAELKMICDAKVGEYHGSRYPPYLLEWLTELKPQ